MREPKMSNNLGKFKIYSYMIVLKSLMPTILGKRNFRVSPHDSKHGSTDTKVTPGVTLWGVHLLDMEQKKPY